jgi:hypothetical protein
MALEAAGAQLDHVMKWSAFLVQGQRVETASVISSEPGTSARTRRSSRPESYPGWRTRHFLDEREAVAVVPGVRLPHDRLRFGR